LWCFQSLLEVLIPDTQQHESGIRSKPQDEVEEELIAECSKTRNCTQLLTRLNCSIG